MGRCACIVDIPKDVYADCVHVLFMPHILPYLAALTYFGRWRRGETSTLHGENNLYLPDICYNIICLVMVALAHAPECIIFILLQNILDTVTLQYRRPMEPLKSRGYVYYKVSTP